MSTNWVETDIRTRLVGTTTCRLDGSDEIIYPNDPFLGFICLRENETDRLIVEALRGIPPGRYIVLKIDDELIFCDSMAGNEFRRLTRGFDGTSPADHGRGAVVTYMRPRTE